MHFYDLYLQKAPVTTTVRKWLFIARVAVTQITVNELRLMRGDECLILQATFCTISELIFKTFTKILSDVIESFQTKLANRLKQYLAHNLNRKILAGYEPK